MYNMFLLESAINVAPKPVSGAVLALLILLFVLHRRLAGTNFPTINEYPGDWFRVKAKEAFISHAEALLQKGRTKYEKQPFRIITTLGEKLVLPHSYFDFVKSHPDLDHQKQVAEEFFGSYPGFEGIGAFNDPNKMVINLVKKKMSSINKDMLEVFEQEAERLLSEELGDAKEFHPIAWPRICSALISRMSSNIFVGPTLASNPEWQKITATYTVNLFQACRSLRTYPRYLRPIAVWFLPTCRVCREQVREARILLAKTPPEANTSRVWSDAGSDEAATQLALAAGALHTTSQLLNQCLLDLAYAQSDGQLALLENVRWEFLVAKEETDGQVRPSTLPKLTLLDACIKETQRLKPQTLTNLERLATRDIVLPDGNKIKAGTMICVDSAPMWEAARWGDDAKMWKPKRILEGKERKSLVSSSEDMFAFGAGRFICPGRFMVNAELKMALGKILEGWEVRLRKEDFEKANVKGLGRVHWVGYGFEQIADESVVIEVRRRKPS